MSIPFACEYLARIGFATLAGVPADKARPHDHATARDAMLAVKPTPLQGREGVAWFCSITWPDRLPGLKPWAGNATLAKIIRDRLKLIKEADDLFALKYPMDTASGIDGLSCQDSRDIGFSPSAIGMPVVQRPGVELLAIVGMECVPLVSFRPGHVGFLHDGRAWRIVIERRSGSYHRRWGRLMAVDLLADPDTSEIDDPSDAQVLEET